MGQKTNESNIEAVVNAGGWRVSIDKRYDREENPWYITEKVDYRGDNGVIVPAHIEASDEGDYVIVTIQDTSKDTEYVLHSLFGGDTEGIKRMTNTVVSGIVGGNRIYLSADCTDIAFETMESSWIKVIPKGKHVSRKTVVTLYENEHDDVDTEVTVTDEYKLINVITTVVKRRDFDNEDGLTNLNVRVIRK